MHGFLHLEILIVNKFKFQSFYKTNNNMSKILKTKICKMNINKNKLQNKYKYDIKYNSN